MSRFGRPLITLSADPARASGEGPAVGTLLSHVLAQEWALQERVLESLLGVVARHDAGVRVEPAAVAEIVASRSAGPRAYGVAMGRMGGGNDDRNSERGYVIVDGIAVIPVGGVIAKHASQVNGASQPQGTAVETVRVALASALNDRAVRGVLLHVESPGGTVAGVKTGAEEIFRAAADGQMNAGKPVWGFADDLAASAGYWLLSQTSRVLATPTAEVGSIGVYALLADSSQRAKSQGVSVHLVKSAPLKGGGAPGLPIDDATLAAFQSRVDALHAAFVADVARGRGVDTATAAQWGTGGVWTGQAAADAGLVDGIVNSAEEAVAEMVASIEAGTRHQASGISPNRGVRHSATTHDSPLTTHAITTHALTTHLSPLSEGDPMFIRARSGPLFDPAGASPPAPPAAPTAAAPTPPTAPTAAAPTPPTPPSAPTPSGSSVVNIPGSADVLKAERERVTQIEARAELFKVHGPTTYEAVQKIAVVAKRDGWSPEAFGDYVLKTQAQAAPAVGKMTGTDAGGAPSSSASAAGNVADMLSLSITEDERDKRTNVAAVGLAMRMMPSAFSHASLQQHGSRYVQYTGASSLAELERLAAAARPIAHGHHGVKSLAIACAATFIGTSRDHAEAIMRQSPIRFMGAVGHTSSDFPLILSNAANKLTQAYFAEQSPTWEQYCATRTLNDYKDHTIAQLSESGNFELIPTGATPSRTTFNERVVRLFGEDYGRQIAFDHKMIINDDLGLFSDALSVVNRAYLRLVPTLVTNMLNANNGAGPTQPDGNPFFHASRGNIAASPGALADDTLEAAYIAIRDQKGFGPDRPPLDLNPRLLLHPLRLNRAATDLFTQQYTPGTAGAQMRENPQRGRFRPIEEIRLTRNTGWYLLCEPGQAPIITVGFLNGQRTPRIDQLPNANPLAVVYQFTLMGVGTTMLNPEAGFFNAGS